MQSYCLIKKFRGQPVRIAGDRAHITIRTAQPQRDTPPTVGLSDALLEYIDRYKITLYVTVQYPKASFKTTAKQWMRGAKKEEQPSYYNIAWYIYRKPIPREAFKKENPVVKPDPDLNKEEEKERQEFYKHQFNYL